MDEARAPAAIDTHTHLNHPRLLRRLESVLARAREAGVTEMVVVGYDLGSSETAVGLAQQHPGLWAAVGVHPHDAAGLDEEAVAALRRLAGSPRVVAIGETGLDFYRDLSPRDAQIAAFRRQLDLGAELGLPVVIHCREAQDALLGILRERVEREQGLVWHCFDGTRDEAEAALALGAVLGFTGVVTYRRSEALREVAAGAPDGQVVLETDCPYLAPEPHRRGDNEPANLGIIARRLAEARGVTEERLRTETTETARRVFGLAERRGDA